MIKQFKQRNLYVKHIEKNLYVKCNKLTRAHIELTSFSRMKVSLANQVLSSSVANGLEKEYGEVAHEQIFWLPKYQDL